jgi:hypothetical protein
MGGFGAKTRASDSSLRAVSKVIISLLDGDNASIRSQVPQINGASGFANS